MCSKSLISVYKKKTTLRLSKEEKGQIFKDCGAISLFEVSSVVLKATDNLILAAFIGLDIVGLYSNYLMIYNALKKVIKRIIRSAQASLGDLFTDSELKTKHEFFSVVNLVVVLICGTFSVCVAVLSDEFITTWIGSGFVIAMPFSLMIALELYTIGLKLNLEQIRNVMGLFPQMKIRPILSVILNVAVSVVAVRYYGIYGVLLGTLISERTTTLIIDPYMVYKYGFKGDYKTAKYYIRNVWYVFQLAFVGVLNWWFVKNVFEGYGWLSLMFHAIVCVTTTFGFILLINCRSRQGRIVVERLKVIMTSLRRNKSM